MKKYSVKELEEYMERIDANYEYIDGTNYCVGFLSDETGWNVIENMCIYYHINGGEWCKIIYSTGSLYVSIGLVRKLNKLLRENEKNRKTYRV